VPSSYYYYFLLSFIGLAVQPLPEPTLHRQTVLCRYFYHFKCNSSLLLTEKLSLMLPSRCFSVAQKVVLKLNFMS